MGSDISGCVGDRGGVVGRGGNGRVYVHYVGGVVQRIVDVDRGDGNAYFVGGKRGKRVCPIYFSSGSN